jgi:hypothetical protein
LNTAPVQREIAAAHGTFVPTAGIEQRLIGGDPGHTRKIDCPRVITVPDPANWRKIGDGECTSEL